MVGQGQSFCSLDMHMHYWWFKELLKVSPKELSFGLFCDINKEAIAKHDWSSEYQIHTS